MPRLRRVCFFLILLTALAPVCQPQTTYERVPRTVVEERLAKVVKGNALRKAILQDLFREAGCTGDRLTEQPVKSEKLPNVICTLRGSTDRVIVVGAHFDHVSHGDGVVDNWSGASLLPSLFQSIMDAARTHTYVFVGFTGEESGLVGSRYYVNQLTAEQKECIEAMVNIDSLGLSSTKVWVSYSDQEYVGYLNGLAISMKLPLAGVNVERVGDGDSSPFRKAHIRTVTVHSVTQETLKVLHSARDKMSAIRMDDYYDSYKLLAAYLVLLDQVAGPAPDK